MKTEVYTKCTLSLQNCKVGVHFLFTFLAVATCVFCYKSASYVFEMPGSWVRGMYFGFVIMSIGNNKNN